MKIWFELYMPLLADVLNTLLEKIGYKLCHFSLQMTSTSLFHYSHIKVKKITKKRASYSQLSHSDQFLYMTIYHKGPLVNKHFILFCFSVKNSCKRFQ